MMPTRVRLAVLVATVLPGLAVAQQASPPGIDLSIDRMQRRPVVLPKPSPEQSRTDAETALDAYLARTNMHRVVKETSPVRPPERPDLDDDVSGGIQTQRLNRALRNR